MMFLALVRTARYVGPSVVSYLVLPRFSMTLFSRLCAQVEVYPNDVMHNDGMHNDVIHNDVMHNDVMHNNM